MKPTNIQSSKIACKCLFILVFSVLTPNALWAVEKIYLNSLGMEFVMFGRRKGTADHPVTKVSWYDCENFIEKLNALNEGVYRLPTEAEWEYACRAGTTTAYSWGDSINCERAMYANNRLKAAGCIKYVKSRLMKINRPAPVKSYPPNAWGLYDMHGNVWEWCFDHYAEDYDLKDNKDPQGCGIGMAHSRRGGSWYKYGYACRSANRAYGHASTRFKTTGFRVVRRLNE